MNTIRKNVSGLGFITKPTITPKAMMIERTVLVTPFLGLNNEATRTIIAITPRIAGPVFESIFLFSL